MTDTEILTIAFHVPTGLEDYALSSILHQLGEHISAQIKTAAPLHSSHVLIRFPSNALLTQAIQIYATGALWAVYEAFICVAEVSLDDVHPVLGEEFWEREREMGRKARENQRENALRKRLARAHKEQTQEPKEAEEGEPLHAERPTPTAGELLLLSSLHKLVTSHSSQLQESISLLHPPPSFRATFSNPSRLLPLSTLRRRDIERHLGDTLSLFLPIDQWSVNLTNPGVDVHVRLLPLGPKWTSHTLPPFLPAPELTQPPLKSQHFPPSLWALLALSFPPPPTPAHRLPPLQGPTSLSPPIAHLLALVYISLFPNSVVVLDPCAGTCSIPRELAALAKERKHPIFVLGGDISLSALADPCQCIEKIQYTALESLPLRFVDGFITDLPWGTRHLSPRQVKVFYPKLMLHLAEVMRAEGRGGGGGGRGRGRGCGCGGRGGGGVLMSAARGGLDRALHGWEKEGVREVRVGGRVVWVWGVRKV
ncbi:hypothetical protein DACRYDRAFT_100672 [Dacryopinax primogenitus]|uniref:Uncharacterized protein n=1 Tax=Dacryopinax primogenitus (strain DJM 731) TaxID=1858805 RepID=M5G9L3_DACPD|nr:uncharacterized protein DACRYDRAFT_100672 [Dacryopinax primogenitus]EJU00503.1 hypothetical protein DACRYDRAFT_100672 [Dacryopinax primogenitus]